MKHQRPRIGIYKAFGRMNNRLVYKQLSPSSEGHIYYWQNPLDLADRRWYVGSNYSSDSHGLESPVTRQQCVAPEDGDGKNNNANKKNLYRVYTKYPNHVFDNSAGWHADPSIRMECYDIARSQNCCPTVEVTSNSYGSTLFPHLMGTYVLTSDYQVSGRRVYQQVNGEHLVYLHDWGPTSGMEWVFSLHLGSPQFRSIVSDNVENAFPMNLCLDDASSLGAFQVWDGDKWQPDPTLSVSCTFFH